jgi:hypothetical protein
MEFSVLDGQPLQCFDWVLLKQLSHAVLAGVNASLCLLH